MERDERPPSGGGGGGGSAGFLEPPAALPPPPRNGFCQDELAELDPGTNGETDSLTLGQGHIPVSVPDDRAEQRTCHLWGPRYGLALWDHLLRGLQGVFQEEHLQQTGVSVQS